MIRAPTREIIERFGTYVVGSGSDVAEWTMARSLGSFDEVDSLLAHQHEFDHADLLTSTPIGVLLAKLHMFQFSRMKYMIAKLDDRSSGRPLAVRPPFSTWLRDTIASEVNLNSATMTYEEITSVDESLGHPFAISEEIDSYRLAEQILTADSADNFAADAAFLNEALGNIAEFQMVHQPRPVIVEGDDSLGRHAADSKLTGEAIIEAHAILLELLILRGGHADESFMEDWKTHRVRTPVAELNSGVRVLELFERSNELRSWPLSIGVERLLLELAMLAPLEPATWAREILPLNAVHPVLRLLRLLWALSNSRALTAETFDAKTIDALFEVLGWPTLSDLQHRAETQAARGPGLYGLARLQHEALRREDSWDLDITAVADQGLRAGLNLRRANPSLRAVAHGNYLTVEPLEYYSDGVLAAGGIGTTTLARHDHLMESLLGAWLLHDDESMFRLASLVNYSMARSSRLQWREGNTSTDPRATEPPQFRTPETILSEVFLAAK